MDPVVAFFLLGIAARAIRSDLRMPEALYEALSIYLLIAIGLKGGIALASQLRADLLLQSVVVMALGAALAFIAFIALHMAVKLSVADAGSVAAHYGSVSVVTYAVGLNALRAKGYEPEGELALFLALMEVPGILVGVMLVKLARRDTSARTVDSEHWSAALIEALRGKSVVLLIGGIVIGAAFGAAALKPITPLFEGLFKGALALFLLELGLITASKWPDIKAAGWRLVAFAIVFPLLAGALGAGVGLAMGLSVAGAALLATLAASASYIAAPAATRVAIPEANPALGIAAALGVTFTFNVTVGIPLYLYLVQSLSRMSA
jgi:uncharacterized protein